LQKAVQDVAEELRKRFKPRLGQAPSPTLTARPNGPISDLMFTLTDPGMPRDISSLELVDLIFL
jgi:hypothetical protein